MKKNIIIFSVYLIAILAVFMLLIKVLLTYVDEEKLKNDYEWEKSNCELLYDVCDKVIGNNGVNLENIPTDKISYKIYTDADDNIVFYYYIKDYKDRYHATITLSNDYVVLNKVYSKTPEPDFETYKHNMSKFYNTIIIIVVLIPFAFLVIWGVKNILFFNKKKQNT